MNEQKIKEILSTIRAPKLAKDILSLGLVRNIKIEKNLVHLDLLKIPQIYKDIEHIELMIKEALTSLGFSEIKIHLLEKTSPQKTTDTSKTNKDSGLKKVKNIIAIASCKGGVGKSTVSALLAKEMADQGYKVGLLDADIYGPSVPSLFQMSSEKLYTDENEWVIPLQKWGVKLMSFGFVAGDGPAILRGPIISGYTQQLLHKVAWGDLDYLLIDMPPGTGDIQLTITQSIQLDGALIVTTRQQLSLVDVSKGILMFEKVKIPMLGIIENMSYMLCSHCGKKDYFFGKPEDKNSLSSRFGLKTVAELPFERKFNRKIEEQFNSSYFKEALHRILKSYSEIKSKARDIPEFKQDSKKVYFRWADGHQISVNFKELRALCQCALCIDEYTGKQLLNVKNIREDITVKEITPLGHYAVAVKFSDGHSSSIYPYEYLRKLP